MGYLDIARETMKRIGDGESESESKTVVEEVSSSTQSSIDKNEERNTPSSLPSPTSTVISPSRGCDKSDISDESPTNSPDPISTDCDISDQSDKRSFLSPDVPSPRECDKSDISDKSPWDPILASLLHGHMKQRFSGDYPKDFGFRVPDETCRTLQEEVQAAFDRKDIAAAYVAIIRYQDVVYELFRQHHPKRRTAAFRHPWWPNRSHCLIWKTPPQAPCPECAGRHFWRIDGRGFLCRDCCPPLACKPVEQFELTEETPEAAPPKRLVWWNRNQYPPVWLLREYELNNTPMYPPEFIRLDHGRSPGDRPLTREELDNL